MTRMKGSPTGRVRPHPELRPAWVDSRRPPWMRALVVEDDRSMAKLVRLLLEEEGFAVDTTESGEHGLTLAAEHPYDVLVLDLGLPDRAGLTIVRDLRASHAAVPVLILTGRTSPDDVVRGLDVGADDYLAKPFVNAVFKARVRALIRRGGARRPEQLSCGDLRINRLTREVLVAGVAVSLTPREYRLLEHLALHAESPIARSELLAQVWDMHFDPGTNVVDALVSRVRRKLRAIGAAPRIVSVHGFGYQLTARREDA